MADTDSPVNLIRLDRFDPKKGFSRGRPLWVMVLWQLFRVPFFMSSFPWPSSLRRVILRAFGAKIGASVVIKSRVNVLHPWRLIIGDHCWLGESCELMNHEWITLQSHVALAHEVFLAAGSHDIQSATMAYHHSPIVIKSGSWVATRVFIGPGVTIARGCVVCACAVVIKKEFPEFSIIAGNPAKVIGQRQITRDLVDSDVGTVKNMT